MSVSSSTKWIAPYHKRNPQAALRLFCFPYAGGGASVFANWTKQLPPEIEVCPVQFPGRENRLSEPCLDSVIDGVGMAAEALTPYFDIQFAFFGYSLGALIAYELVRTLRRTSGLQPLHLIASARRAPQLLPHRESAWHLPDVNLKRRLEELNGTPKEVLQNKDLMELMLPLLRADFRLDETYRHPSDYEPLDCPITVLGGMQDTEVPTSDLRAWSEVTRGNFDIKMLDGDHFFIHSQTSSLIYHVNQILLRYRYVPCGPVPDV